MRRRQFLRLSLGAVAAFATSTLWALPQPTPRFLLVFLRGGYDATNVLVPIASDFYYEVRPNLAIARPGAASAAAIELDSSWGLHPALRDSVLPLYRNRQIAFVPFCGSDDLTRSHFETQDTIELGQPLDRTRDEQSGFLDRLAEVLGTSASPISFTAQLSQVFRGSRDVPNMALRSLAKAGLDHHAAETIASMYAHTSLASNVREGFGVRDQVLASFAAEMDAASRQAVTPTGFQAEARRVAQLLRDKFNLAFIDVGGWDTHVAQGGATGYLANRLDELGRGLSIIAQELGAAWRDTVVVVLSEFGRTFRENGNRGTDHGHGSVYWVLGGSVGGGRVAGEQIVLDSSTLFQNRDYPVLNDYRGVLAGLFQQMYGLDQARLARVFAEVKPAHLALV